jgi:hypothetical protein
LVGATPAAASIRITGNVTVEAVVMMGSGAGLAGVICVCSGNNTDETEAGNALFKCFITDTDVGFPSFFWENGAGANNQLTATLYTIIRHRWTHIAWVRDVSGGAGATTARIYINGFLAAESLTLNPPTGGTTARLWIGGGENVASQFWPGHISSVKVIAAALTQAQVQDEVRRTIVPSDWNFSGAGDAFIPQLHDTTHSPVSLWQLDDSYADDGTAGETLSLVTGSDLVTEGAVSGGFPSTKFDGATRLAGAGTAPAALQILGSMTVEALIRSGEDSGIGVIASVAGDYGSALEAQNILWDLRILEQSTGTLRFIWESGAGTVHSISTTDYVLSRHAWNHIAAVRDATGGIGATIAKIYVNGREVATTSTLSPATGGASAITRIGGSNLAAQFYGGNLASVKVIASALSQAQIQDEVRRTLPSNMWAF